jgi:hypothetical protein
MKCTVGWVPLCCEATEHVVLGAKVYKMLAELYEVSSFYYLWSLQTRNTTTRNEVTLLNSREYGIPIKIPLSNHFSASVFNVCDAFSRSNDVMMFSVSNSFVPNILEAYFFQHVAKFKYLRTPVNKSNCIHE